MATDIVIFTVQTSNEIIGEDMKLIITQVRTRLLSQIK